MLHQNVSYEIQRLGHTFYCTILLYDSCVFIDLRVFYHRMNRDIVLQMRRSERKLTLLCLRVMTLQQLVCPLLIHNIYM